MNRRWKKYFYIYSLRQYSLHYYIQIAARGRGSRKRGNSRRYFRSCLIPDFNMVELDYKQKQTCTPLQTHTHIHRSQMLLEERTKACSFFFFFCKLIPSWPWHASQREPAELYTRVLVMYVLCVWEACVSKSSFGGRIASRISEGLLLWVLFRHTSLCSIQPERAGTSRTSSKPRASSLSMHGCN